MSDPKTTVISVRLTPAVHAALSDRAAKERQPLTRLAALLIEDAVVPRPKLAAPVDGSRHHQSGPVLASAVPSVAGVATGFHPKASWNPRTKKGSGDG